ncbi:MAG: GNAT family N-acetyltransferase [Chloroflexi bacterium]|nr:GNAT family N-acetyltransferase [Chloroflexota bacterium]
MQIRIATAGDLKSCMALDNAYETDHVWQMQAEVGANRVDAVFQFTRLPRPVVVKAPLDGERLRLDWARHECFLVADHAEEVLGFLDMTVRRWQNVGWINHLVVDRQYRRHGIGKALLRMAHLWAEQEQIRALMLETEPKNHPAIQLYQQQGFSFCGYNDQYYNNNDIAIFFACRMK